MLESQDEPDLAKATARGHVIALGAPRSSSGQRRRGESGRAAAVDYPPVEPITGTFLTGAPFRLKPSEPPQALTPVTLP